MAFDKIVGVDGTTYQFPTLVRTRISDNIKLNGSLENLAVKDAMSASLALKSDTTHNHNLADLNNNGIDYLSDVEIGVVGPNGIALDDKHTLQYELSTNKWRNKVASGGVTVGDSRPTSPIPGDAWFDSNDGTLYVYYADANTTQWVQVKANSALEGTILARLGALESRATALEAVPEYSPNYVINGAFDINQRNFTSITTNAYGFDRWRQIISGDGTKTYSSQTFTLGGEPSNAVAASKYARMDTVGQTLTTSRAVLATPIEDVKTLAGQTVTVSFWARAASGAPKVVVEFQQNFGTGGSPSTSENVLAGQVVLSTSWARYSLTVAIPSMAGKTLGTDVNSSFTYLGLWVSAGSTFDSRTGSMGIQNNTFDFWGVQVESTPIATPFRRNSNSIQGELAACQRYYYGIQATHVYSFFGQGYGYTSTNTEAFVQFPVAMRVAPTSIDFSNVAHFMTSDGTTSRPATGLSLFAVDKGTNAAGLSVTVASGITTLRYYTLLAYNTTAAFLGFDAEL